MKSKLILSLFAIIATPSMIFAQSLTNIGVEATKTRNDAVTTPIGSLYDAGSVLNNLTVNAKNFNLAEFNSSKSMIDDASYYDEAKSVGLEEENGLSTTTDIDDVPIAVLFDNVEMYNIIGNLVDRSYIGIVVIKGKKYFKRQAY